jgi:hypothetical protein
MEAWIAENWFNILSAFGIVGSLLFAAFSLRSETKTRRIANLLTLTEGHRDIWSQIFLYPELARILRPTVDLKKQTVTENEELYVRMIIQHLSAAFEAIKDDLSIKPEALGKDVHSFFTLPIPRIIWKRSRAFQDEDFRKYVEDCLKDE